MQSNAIVSLHYTTLHCTFIQQSKTKNADNDTGEKQKHKFQLVGPDLAKTIELQADWSGNICTWVLWYFW